MLDLPLAQGRQQQLHVALVADEVVVHQEHRAAPAQVVEPLQLGDQLLGGLGAWLAPVEHDDVAELAVERATSGELHRHLRVGVEFQQVVARHRRGGHVRFLASRREAATGLAPLQGLHEQGQGDFSFVEHLEIGLVQLRSVGCGTGEGTAHGHWQSAGLCAGDLFGHVGLLHDHPRDHHQLGPGPLLLAHLTHVAIHQFHLPALGQQGRHGHQPQGGEQHLAVDQLENLFVTPEGFGEFRVDEQGAHVLPQREGDQNAYAVSGVTCGLQT